MWFWNKGKKEEGGKQIVEGGKPPCITHVSLNHIMSFSLSHTFHDLGGLM